MKRPLKCDLHIHSQFSDGKLTVPEIVDLYGQHGFGAIAITDHLCEKNGVVGRVSHGLSYSLTEEIFPYYMETLKNEADRAMRQYGMLVIPGYEITKNSFSNHRSAHILVIGSQEYINPNQSVDEILEHAKSLKALTVAAHPFYTGDFEFQTFHLWSRREKLKHFIDAWEVNYRKKICADVLNSGLPLIASSDFHHQAHFSSWKTKIWAELNMTSIFDSIRNQQLDFFLDIENRKLTQKSASLLSTLTLS